MGNGYGPFNHWLKKLANQIQDIYDLQVLIPKDKHAQIPSSSPSVSQPSHTGAISPKVRLYEKIFYTISLIICVPLMFAAAYNASGPSNPNYDSFSRLLSKSYIPGLFLDNTDLQYASFRDNVVPLISIALVHLISRDLFNRFSNSSHESNVSKRLFFDTLFNTLYIFVLHGFNIIKITLILFCNYHIAKLPISRPYAITTTWLFCIALFFLNDWTKGLQIPISFIPSYLEFRGLMGNWEVYYKITMLRMVSFNMDYLWWSEDMKKPTLTDINSKKSDSDSSDLSEKLRNSNVSIPCQYSFLLFYNYVFYAPLYLSGPIITFNNFVSQIAIPIKRDNVILTHYAIRWIFSFIIMEIMLHTIYVVAISKVGGWRDLPATQISMIGYFNLHIIWLKLLIIWRFFRMWAMLDNIQTPENMIRCMSNNYSVIQFWRSWHRSFNKWIIRYIYIPIGGSKSPIMNTVIVFTFVAIWHDIKFRLLAWGWLVAIFIVPEMIASTLMPQKVYGNNLWFRYLSVLGAEFNIILLMIANLVGFSIGTDGTMDFLKSLIRDWKGLLLCISVLVALFAGVLAMFQTREEEISKGYNIKC